MDAVVGLGQAGCNIADYFGSNYTQYQIYRLDKGLNNGLNTFTLPNYAKHEEYDQNPINLKFFFTNLRDSLLFVVGGAGLVSGAILRVLEQIKDREITILYIRPDVVLLSEEALLREKVTFNILQEYTRSGVFKNMILVSNPQLEQILGGVSILDYNVRLNELLCGTFHMMNAFKHIPPAMSTFSGLNEISRLSTMGMVDFEKEHENLFYPLEDMREKAYYYLINEEKLKKDKQILSKIKDFIKIQPCKASYTVWSTNYDHDYVYVYAYSSTIQK
tara:strand:- start:1003 stop:1827 length:825 start_codon:yes stop_codon:yes gene_type:complete